MVLADGACLRGGELENTFVPQTFALALEDADFIGSLLSLAAGGLLHRGSVRNRHESCILPQRVKFKFART
jgi:hypothetical protein